MENKRAEAGREEKREGKERENHLHIYFSEKERQKPPTPSLLNHSIHSIAEPHGTGAKDGLVVVCKIKLHSTKKQQTLPIHLRAACHEFPLSMTMAASKREKASLQEEEEKQEPEAQ